MKERMSSPSPPHIMLIRHCRVLLTRLLLIGLLLITIDEVVGVRMRLKQKIYPSSSPLTSTPTPFQSSSPIRISEAPLTAAQFLRGQEDVQMNQEEVKESETDQQVLIESQAAHQQQQQHPDASLLSSSSRSKWIVDGKPSVAFEPIESWPPGIDVLPHTHLVSTEGSHPTLTPVTDAVPDPKNPTPHNLARGALGVQSASIPWEYRHYTGQLNSHRGAEPLIYTPIVLATNSDGRSAVNLNQLVNARYRTERRRQRKLPQYANTLSPELDFVPVPPTPNDWMPKMPSPNGMNRNSASGEDWKKHILDLYAPTPPPFVTPRVPRSPAEIQQERWNRQQRQQVWLETKAHLPSLPQTQHVQPLITQLHDEKNQPIPFHDEREEEKQWKHAREMNIEQPANYQNQEGETQLMEMESEISEEKDQQTSSSPHESHW